MNRIKFDHPQWIADGSGLYTPKYFESIDRVHDDKVRVSASIGQAKSKFPGKNIQGLVPDDRSEIDPEYIMLGIAAFGDTSVEIPSKNMILEMTERDILTIDISIPHKISGQFYVTELLGSPEKKVFGSGEKEFEVVATIRDEYRLKVFANSEEEAIDIANATDISDWQHPTIEPHLVDRKIIRHARWGNLKATEVS
jgi:hypothetical protein